MSEKFSRWIDTLNEDVVEGEYGYERGEFSVSPEDWRPMFREGLTPQQAFRRALDAHSEARAEEERRKMENWHRIQAEDAKYAAPPAPAKRFISGTETTHPAVRKEFLLTAPSHRTKQDDGN
jgi:hypothetical protein